ncbi:XrtA/PEP-CTERM system histidine kinase PrsK [Pseudoduganella namucuonensis]|uniref:histidine kinase n=1 Tax=Pseudoduganella namucuonensis TaxID=1035707 RepID=A0A1I7GEW8_9BURK|nr:XrtA/PEP-CTERM system histidine kinase PrsK [Pseudoduganella namucuonensis]SFU46871.1 putative PEP-CTERM system histidine kinase [Pseudoduganella namucuonensis]
MINIAFISYGAAAVAFFLLLTALLTVWRGRVRGSALTLASFLSCLWSAAMMYQGTQSAPTHFIDALETLRNGAWSVFLLILLGHFRDPGSRLPMRLKPSVLAGLAVYAVWLVATLFGRFEVNLLPSAGLPVALVHLCMALVGLLLVEQVYRNKPVQERWAIKYVCLGVGAMFAYDFYLYSDAILFRSVDEQIWAARGVINGLITPLVAISVSRSATWSSSIAVSRRVVFHTAALFGTAIYLLAMGSAGYYLRLFGGTWGTLMEVAFLFAAAILLVGILFSGTFRAWLKVFISKHFYSYNYDYREEWLRFTRTLSAQGPGLPERTIQAVAELVESTGGALWIARESGLCEPVAGWHMAPPTEPVALDTPFCQYLNGKQWVIDLREYAENPALYDGVAIPAWLSRYERGWLVVPLILQGKLFGFVLLQEPRSEIKLNWEVIDLLKVAGTQASSYLAQQEVGNALTVARQFESFNRMSTFIVHDLKNLVSQLSLLMTNAEKHRHNPEFQRDMIETVEYSVQKMTLLLHKLSRSATPELPAPLALDALLAQAVALKSGFEPRPALKVRDAALHVLADHERLERVVGHLIQNAIEATGRDGQVDVSLRREEQRAVIAISDNGKGMSEDFIRERLFKPFESTKSAGMGIGVFESREYVCELGGQLEVSSQPGRGTTFTIMLPIYKRAA